MFASCCLHWLASVCSSGQPSPSGILGLSGGEQRSHEGSEMHALTRGTETALQSQAIRTIHRGFILLWSLLREDNLLIKLNMHIAHVILIKDLLHYIPAVRDIKILCLN